MTDTILGPAYRIHTQRLVVRCWEPADAALLSQAMEQNLDHLRPWLLWAYTETVELQERVAWLLRCRGKFDLGEDLTYAIFNREETKVLGSSGLHTRGLHTGISQGSLEIGYWIHKEHINQGLVTEASAALTKVGFEIEKVDRVEIHCVPDNVRSAAVPSKLGFTHEATLRQRAPTHDRGLRDIMIWTLFKDEYPTSPAAVAEIEAFDALGRRII